jgi:hypothetical protein
MQFLTLFTVLSLSVSARPVPNTIINWGIIPKISTNAPFKVLEDLKFPLSSTIPKPHLNGFRPDEYMIQTSLVDEAKNQVRVLYTSFRYAKNFQFGSDIEYVLPSYILKDGQDSGKFRLKTTFVNADANVVTPWGAGTWDKQDVFSDVFTVTRGKDIVVADSLFQEFEAIFTDSDVYIYYEASSREPSGHLLIFGNCKDEGKYYASGVI